MNPLLLFFFCFIISVRDSLPGFISTPGIQRRSQSETCTFQWATTGLVTNFRVYNQTLGIAKDLSASASYSYDNNTGVINLSITNVQFWDAGNYSVSLTTGAIDEFNSGALLYVCGDSQNFVNQTAGRNPPTEGDAVELSCTVQPTSLPAAYRPPLYYFWYIGGFGYLQNISNGPAVFLSGDVFTGYSIKNNGRTLAIASAQYQDTGGFLCYGQEEGCPSIHSSAWFNLPLRYRPHAIPRNPVSGKYNPVLYQNVIIFFYFDANPELTSMTNWSFVRSDGQRQDLPSNFQSLPYISSYVDLSFNFTSVDYYGNYSRAATNSIGSTTVTFQVLPQGPPDQPLSIKVIYVTHAEIGLQYSCGWDNGRQQTIFIQLYNIGNDTALSTSNTTFDIGAFNIAVSTTLGDNIEADKEYEAKVWASNALGKSDVVRLKVRTAKKLKFNVSQETIRFNGSQAIIGFTAPDGNVSGLIITCCDEKTGICNNCYFYNTNRVPPTQIICNDIPEGNDYLFDFFVYASIPYRPQFFATMIKGMKVSRTGIIQSNAENNGRTLAVSSTQYEDAKGVSCTTQSNEVKDSLDVNPLRVVVIVLAILLGICFLALVGVSVAFCVWKCRGNGRKKISPAEYNTQPIPPESSKEQEIYEMPVDPDDDIYEEVHNRSSTNYDRNAENEDTRDESKGNSYRYS